MSRKAIILSAMVGLAVLPVASDDAFAFQRGFGGGGHAFAGGHAFGGGRGFGGGFGGRSFGGGFAGRGGFRGYGARYAGGYGRYGRGRGYGYGYGYPGYYDDGGAVAASVIGGLALGALAASAGGF